MATQLPTITVTDAQAGRILAAYKARFGTTTTAATIAAFQRWLTMSVREAVLAHELAVVAEQHNAERAARVATVEAGMPVIPDPPAAP